MSENIRYRALDLSGVRRTSIDRSSRKICAHDLARINEPSTAMLEFLDNLPNILIGKDFREFLTEVTSRRAQGQPVLIMYGGHVVKCGLAPLIIDLMERGYVSGLATNGSGAIHDVEMSLFGRTSEDVAEGLENGMFGMVRETGDFFHDVLRSCSHEGYGEAVGRRLMEVCEKSSKSSLLAAGYQASIPVTVHVAVGTDIIHQHPSMPAEELGRATYLDFRILCNVLSEMDKGGVVINLGSSVILPEVFLKALTVVRNLGFGANNLITANFDMLQHYRPRVNVVERPTRIGGRGFQFTGHHEILIPLLHTGIRCYAELKN